MAERAREHLPVEDWSRWPSDFSGGFCTRGIFWIVGAEQFLAMAAYLRVEAHVRGGDAGREEGRRR